MALDDNVKSILASEGDKIQLKGQIGAKSNYTAGGEVCNSCSCDCVCICDCETYLPENLYQQVNEKYGV